MPKRIMCVVGARPNFMKIAPLMRELQRADMFESYLVHTGQHYDAAMKQAFFEQLQIPEPDEDLGVGSASHAVQTAEIMRRFEPILDRELPDAVLVVGDVNSTIACALVAAKKQVPVIHVEAGLRSFDRTMPEEINRVLTDQVSDLLFTTERGALDNLVREGVDSERVHFVGNVMIDTLVHNRERAPSVAAVLRRAEIVSAAPARFGVVTLHRPSNVDDTQTLARLVDTLSELGAELPLLFPVHPRTASRLGSAGLMEPARGACTLLPPLDYLDMLALLQGATMVLTDSGGIQEETTALGVPCLTLRENTERPITVTQGTNTIVGADPERILGIARSTLRDGGKAGRIPEYWDGRAARRIVDTLEHWFRQRGAPADPTNDGHQP
jgi:UDP-N-acetylglucosamine 2-epimerase (non-hydrolysing)